MLDPSYEAQPTWVQQNLIALTITESHPGLFLTFLPKLDTFKVACQELKQTPDQRSSIPALPVALTM